MSKHTPGDWHVNVWTTGRRTVETGNGLVIAEVHRTHFDSEQVANADVIAASPALLEALKRSQQIIKGYLDICKLKNLEHAAAEVAYGLNEEAIYIAEGQR